MPILSMATNAGLGMDLALNLPRCPEVKSPPTFLAAISPAFDEPRNMQTEDRRAGAGRT
jgi:hypothetical protein